MALRWLLFVCALALFAQVALSFPEDEEPEEIPLDEPERKLKLSSLIFAQKEDEMSLNVHSATLRHTKDILIDLISCEKLKGKCFCDLVRSQRLKTKFLQNSLSLRNIGNGEWCAIKSRPVSNTVKYFRKNVSLFKELLKID